MDYEKSITSQKQILSDSESSFKQIISLQEKADEVCYGIFISDLHSPYIDEAAWRLTIKLLEWIAPQRGFFSVQNDWSDLNGWSLRFADTRSAKERFHQEDFAVIKEYESKLISQVISAAPYLTPVQVLGNHDKRLYSKSRARLPELAEYVIADYMDSLHGIGVIQFSRGLHMNWVRLAPDLVWHHGLSATKSPVTNARKHISYFMEDGMASNVVFGHTHRPSVVEGHSIGYSGVQAVNAPSLCMNKGVSYLTAGFAPDWRQGIAVCEYKPHKRETRIHNIIYRRQGTELIADWRGKEVSVEVGNE